MSKKGYTAEDHVAAYAKYGSIRKAADALGINHKSIERSLAKLDQQPSKTELYGNLGGQTKTIIKKVPKRGVKRYIVTAAQTETKINEAFWNNLLALATYYDAEVLVAPFAYNKQAFGHQTNSKPGGAGKSKDSETFSDLDPALVPYLTSDRVQLARGLVFCGEVQILPTAVDPLSGLETYTGRASGIFPHAKIELRSIPSMRDEPTKFNYTTGCVTKHNYIQKKAGQKGEFHHAYGALIVEVTADGWWVRQLNADKDNVIYDLDVAAYNEGGGSVARRRVEAEALVSGDVHVAEMDPDVLEATWGDGGLVDLLQPKQQILHDVFDMRSRPWQDEQSFHRQFEKHVKDQETVEGELAECATALRIIVPTCPKTVIVRSNHDLKLERWLDNGDYKKDLPNALFFLQAQLAKVEAILAGDDKFNVLRWALSRFGVHLLGDTQFLAEDESYILCKDKSGGIECGNHGHRGPNGSKGTPKGFMKMARKMIIGDKHSAGIYGGVYVTGTCTGPGVAYAKGPSSWSPTHCVVYPNGKRTLVTMWNKRFFAPREGL